MFHTSQALADDINSDDALYVVEESAFGESVHDLDAVPAFMYEKFDPYLNFNEIQDSGPPIPTLAKEAAINKFKLCESGFIVPSDTKEIAHEGRHVTNVLDFLATFPLIYYGNNIIHDIHVPNFGADPCPKSLLTKLTMTQKSGKVLVQGVPEHHVYGVLSGMSEVDGVVFSCTISHRKCHFFYDSSTQKILPIKSSGRAWFRKDLQGHWVLMTTLITIEMDYIIPQYGSSPIGEPALVNIDGIFYYLPAEHFLHVKVQNEQASVRDTSIVSHVETTDGYYLLGMTTNKVRPTSSNYLTSAAQVRNLRSYATIADMIKLRNDPVELKFSKCVEINSMTKSTNLSPAVIRRWLHFRAYDIVAKMKRLKQKKSVYITMQQLMSCYLIQGPDEFTYLDFWEWTNIYTYNRGFFNRGYKTIPYSMDLANYEESRFVLCGSYLREDMFKDWPCTVKIMNSMAYIHGPRQILLTLFSYVNFKVNKASTPLLTLPEMPAQNNVVNNNNNGNIVRQITQYHSENLESSTDSTTEENNSITLHNQLGIRSSQLRTSQFILEINDNSDILDDDEREKKEINHCPISSPFDKG